MGDTAKQFSLQNFRPEGFGYPTGLTQLTQANTVVDYLVVAGGGAGSGDASGGGGAGGFRTASGFSIISSTPYTVTVGAGATGQPNSGMSKGSNTSFSTIISEGGGAGNGGSVLSPGIKNGGSGGGGHGGGSPGQGYLEAGLANTAISQGSNGGTGSGPENGGGGGGGGAGGVGSNASVSPNSNGANGGNGLPSSISGSPVIYAGGGGGGARTSPASGGTGGSSIGGNGGCNSPNTNGSPGTENRGGGGGGGGTTGGNGGKGIVIIRYSDAEGQQATGGTVTTPSGYIVHTFTGDGTFTTNANFGGSATYSIN